MGCRDCEHNLNTLRAELVDEEKYSAELARALANINALVTERATDPTPIAAKELDLMVAIRDELHDLVSPVAAAVSRETEKAKDVQAQVIQAEVSTPKRRYPRGSNSEVDSPSPNGLGDGLQLNVIQHLPLPGRPLPGGRR